MFNRENYIGVNIPKCWICNKRTAILNVIKAGSTFVKVCNECVKFGEKVEVSEVNNKMDHCELIEVVKVRPKK
jgi:ribosome-binding protein aMBF1 (putative translation factor)